MRFRFLPRLAGLLLLAALAPLRAAATIHYTISLANRAENRFGVRMEIPDANQATELDMPVWNGLYQVREFASRILELHASTAAGTAISSAISCSVAVAPTDAPVAVGSIRSRPSACRSTISTGPPDDAAFTWVPPPIRTAPLCASESAPSSVTGLQ